MVKASKGIRKGTRNILRRVPRNRGLSPLTKAMQVFALGERADIVLDPSVHGGQPHHRFHGKTATVVDFQGRAYVLELYEGNKKKRVVALPEHLQKSRG